MLKNALVIHTVTEQSQAIPARGKQPPDSPAAKEAGMPSLQVRDLPEPVYRKLQIDARKEQRSLSQQAIVTLKKGLDLHEDLKDRRRKLLEKIAEASAVIATDRYEDPVKMIREDRERS